MSTEQRTDEDGTTWTRCPECWAHHWVAQPAVGRRRIFCTDACRQAAYRTVRNARDLAAAQAQDLKDQDTRYRRLVALVAVELAGSRLSARDTTERAERIAQAITLQIGQRAAF